MLDDLAAWLLDPSGLTPHGFCLFWDPWLIWTHAIADGAIGLAYFTIPLALLVFARRRQDLAFRPVFWLFAAFILLCGAGHWLDLLTLWVPAYGVQAVVKVMIATVSVGTAIALWPLLPRALALPSRDQLSAANAALRESEARHRANFERSPVPMYILDGAGTITGVSDSWLSLLAYTQAQVIGRHITEFRPAGPDAWIDDMQAVMTRGEVRDHRRRFLRSDGELIEAEVSGRLEHRGNDISIHCVLIDVTARHRAEDALRASEQSLRQAQKMEAVGQLTGGLAHDFNNLLTSISGSLELLQGRLAEGQAHDLDRYIVSAQAAAARAAALTHRLLAFARQQTLDPKPISINRLVAGMEELIRRTMGPAITVEVVAAVGLWNTLVDPHQLDNALLNLCINARDAMPDGGKLTIETGNRWLDDRTAHERELNTGQYVSLCVSDTGNGMTPEVVRRAFDPFFTTKPIGMGTGLGLSMIYGFVQQSGGQARIYSEVGEGTMVCLYLPRYHGDTEPTADRPAESTSVPRAGQSETVLVVDDEPSLRALIAEILEGLGYRAITVGDGAAGLKVLQSNERIDLLVTDVGLPGGMNGRQLADAARIRRPGLNVLFITGYAENAVVSHGHLDHGMHILTKPFTMKALATRIKGLLSAGPGQAG